MKITFKKLFLFGLMLVLTLSFAACGQKEETDTETKTETELETETQEETEIVEVPVTPGKTNLLTGLPTLTDEGVGKRPVAVMVNNTKAAFPQYGIAQADIIFEVPVEGGETRFMAMYGDYTQVPKVCSVRSCRMYFPEYSEGFDAVYVNWGMSDAIRPYVNSLNLTHYEGAYNTGKLFARDAERQKTKALEHTGYFNGPGLPEAMAEAEQRTDIEADKKDTAFHFHEPENVVKPTGDVCETFVVDYYAVKSRFTYDAETNTYLKEHNGNAQIDGVTGTQLAFTNVLILETDIGEHANGTHRDVRWYNGGTGYYISNGAVQKIKWTKAGIESRILLFDENGNELTINAGKSYIGISYFDRVTFE